MMDSLASNKKRIDSIDIVRGIAMVIMALDHVRDFFHIHGFDDDPLNLATTSPALFATRWITHFCAPVFVFLSGASIYLQSLRKTRKQLSIFLLKRGFWLIFTELFIISLAWSFDPFYHVFFLQVIWAIGISMVLLGLIIQLPYKVILGLGLLIVCGHNLLDIPEAAPGFKAGFVWDLLHHGFFALYPLGGNHFILMIYPFVAWTGLMMLGYCTGRLFSGEFTAVQPRKLLVRSGIVLIAVFVALRYTNGYGDPTSWAPQKNLLFTFFSFIKVTKYPPSLLYLCITIGPALLLLALIENARNKFTDTMAVYGRTAFFYYILHFYLIHTIAAVIFFIKGQHTIKEAIASMQNIPFLFVMPGEGYGLPIVYLIWICVVLALFPLCRKYDKYKRSHKEIWWLSYL